MATGSITLNYKDMFEWFLNEIRNLFVNKLDSISSLISTKTVLFVSIDGKPQFATKKLDHSKLYKEKILPLGIVSVELPFESCCFEKMIESESLLAVASGSLTSESGLKYKLDLTFEIQALEKNRVKNIFISMLINQIPVGKQVVSKPHNVVQQSIPTPVEHVTPPIQKISPPHEPKTEEVPIPVPVKHEADPKVEELSSPSGKGKKSRYVKKQGVGEVAPKTTNVVNTSPIESQPKHKIREPRSGKLSYASIAKGSQEEEEENNNESNIISEGKQKKIQHIKPVKHNLFIKKLAENMNGDFLKQHFEKFGHIEGEIDVSTNKYGNKVAKLTLVTKRNTRLERLAIPVTEGKPIEVELQFSDTPKFNRKTSHHDKKPTPKTIIKDSVEDGWQVVRKN